jgi:hypothetical protein
MIRGGLRSGSRRGDGNMSMRIGRRLRRFRRSNEIKPLRIWKLGDGMLVRILSFRVDLNIIAIE